MAINNIKNKKTLTICTDGSYTPYLPDCTPHKQVNSDAITCWDDVEQLLKHNRHYLIITPGNNFVEIKSLIGGHILPRVDKEVIDGKIFTFLAESVVSVPSRRICICQTLKDNDYHLVIQPSGTFPRILYVPPIYYDKPKPRTRKSALQSRIFKALPLHGQDALCHLNNLMKTAYYHALSPDAKVLLLLGRYEDLFKDKKFTRLTEEVQSLLLLTRCYRLFEDSGFQYIKDYQETIRWYEAMLNHDSIPTKIKSRILSWVDELYNEPQKSFDDLYTAPKTSGWALLFEFFATFPLGCVPPL
ncbi:hypothetical protein [Methylobacter sp. YRD-M1]|uniref:hypothetical protein n=1 Tax=Methylobacter sp. YRD-M1 TaxID=2911520 RepID=UPI00227C41DB|nr:hypothetical protein [Methylobacter sp. YRD-M1]WAK01850.1 hypothetical protein LZ558_18855 [Methylobacter sp. YRD-M1]